MPSVPRGAYDSWREGTVHESKVINVQRISSREVTSPMLRSIRPRCVRPKHASLGHLQIAVPIDKLPTAGHRGRDDCEGIERYGGATQKTVFVRRVEFLEQLLSSLKDQPTIGLIVDLAPRVSEPPPESVRDIQRECFPQIIVSRVVDNPHYVGRQKSCRRWMEMNDRCHLSIPQPSE